jgi:hypothetical protein
MIFPYGTGMTAAFFIVQFLLCAICENYRSNAGQISKIRTETMFKSDGLLEIRCVFRAASIRLKKN